MKKILHIDVHYFHNKVVIFLVVSKNLCSDLQHNVNLSVTVHVYQDNTALSLSLCVVLWGFNISVSLIASRCIQWSRWYPFLPCIFISQWYKMKDELFINSWHPYCSNVELKTKMYQKRYSGNTKIQCGCWVSHLPEVHGFALSLNYLK